MSSAAVESKNFPDFVPPTKIAYVDRSPTLHLRRCVLTSLDGKSYPFEKGEVHVGAMRDNDIVLNDETVSRRHCKIMQEASGYVLVDLASTNGTFVNNVRIREAFLTPGCTISVGKTELKFQAHESRFEIVPSAKNKCGDIVGGNAKMREIYSIIEKIAPSSTTVVIEGETGTGKEVVAQSIHKLSSRAKGPLIVLDCGAVPPNLIESELFGHEKGSFTGAVMTRQGLFEMADGGTLFLDELGELPIDLQPKLLRALEQREIRRVGSSKPIKVDVRIIAATNRRLEEEVQAGRFRQDLFYRLSVVRLILPALRNRADDIPLLVDHFLATQPYNLGPDGTQRVRAASQNALECLQKYDWPGNVRELVNAIERAISFCDSGTIDALDLPEHIRSSRPSGRAETSSSPPAKSSPSAPTPDRNLTNGKIAFKTAKEKWVASFERDYIISLLTEHQGNISHAARDAEIDRKYFRKLMKKYEIDVSVFSKR